jgi:hypothetical protein
VKRGLILAAAIAAIANSLALAGVAYNRSTGVRRLVLTEAELPPSWGYSGNSALRLAWLPDLTSGTLTETQLRAAGFDLPPAETTPYEYSPALGRAVAVAMDVGGPARQAWIDRFYVHAQPQAEPPPTRLVVVDVGRDLASMRAAHPDENRTIVLWALVVPTRVSDEGGRWTWRANVSTLLPNDIHLPLGMRDATTTTRSGENQPYYDVVLCIGSRGEPWIESVTPRGRR